ncbi:MAG: transposase [Candidatus Eremiobacteraeota bacterium]|nr:transposase [Candidatus Eremiobacteraeota bacterium]MBV8262411.1 transposase [Candidatus Eremiobacteraeota bacterium]MBV8460843.1 transposase [Candidatus Eremiobacteraeota bacterium]
MTKTLPRLKGFDYGACRTYFVTFCLKATVKAFSQPRAADIACSVIKEFRQKAYYYLYAYCVMPDHVHILIRKTANAPTLPLLVAMLKRSIVWQCRLSGIPIEFQTNFYDRIVRDYECPDDFVTYVLMNPVRARLTESVGDYPYCGKVDAWM